jgi:hypothetical protein
MSEKEPLQYVTNTANNVYRRTAHLHTRGAVEHNQDQTGMVMVQAYPSNSVMLFYRAYNFQLFRHE